MITRLASLTLAITLVMVSNPLTAMSVMAATGPGRGGEVAYTVTLMHGQTATVFLNGEVRIVSVDKKTGRRKITMTRIRPMVNGDLTAGELRSMAPSRALQMLRLPSKKQATLQLDLELKNGTLPFEPHEVIVVYKTGTTGTRDVVTVSGSSITRLLASVKKHATAGDRVPDYTNDAQTNLVLASLGVTRSARLFRRYDRSTLEALHAGTASLSGVNTLDIANAYLLHVVDASERHAVAALAKLPSVAYASPNWRVGSMATDPIPLPKKLLQQAAAEAQTIKSPIVTNDILGTDNLPANYAVKASGQSMLNAPGVDDVAAYDEIERHFSELPGQGEIITNVSLGDLDDASAASNANDPCNGYVNRYGPTTVLMGGQRYIQWPTMPLVPTYTADDSGKLNGGGEVCGEDPGLTEVGLDLSVMAPLPNKFSGSAVPYGYFNLLGIAPGAKYRLVVPGDSAATSADLLGAFLGAATQTPRPNVITASLGFAFDQYGFPTRYLEEDPLIGSLIASIVQQYHIVVCISAGDGTRTYTATAIGPSGGSAATQLLKNGGTPTTVSDLAYSTAPSTVFDSGSIDVGATTLDDISANPPQFATNQQARSQQAYTETRWDGFQSFSSGFGTRVDVAAPGDNIVADSHALGEDAGTITDGLTGGTSASAPEVAAAAAIALQVAHLTGHPLANPEAVRTLLEETGTTVPTVPQADTQLTVGKQIDIRRMVETLLERGGITESSRVPRVAIAQRQSARFGPENWDVAFASGTNPAAIDLQDGWNLWSGCFILGPTFGSCSPTGENSFAPITIAPDWEFLPTNTSYRLTVVPGGKVLATTPWARLYPSEILSAAGQSLASTSSRTVKLRYEAGVGRKRVAVTFKMTFGPSVGTESAIAMPDVPPVVQGKVITVHYDLTNTVGLGKPMLLVSAPARFSLAGFLGSHWFPAWSKPLTVGSKGTVEVPVSALQGGGIYGITIWDEDDAHGIFGLAVPGSDVAFTRVIPPSAASAGPQAPTLSANGSTPRHFLEIPLGGSFTIHYDATNVPGATGVMLEVSAAGMTNSALYNTFNNPNGSERDDNAIDTGSVYYGQLSGMRGLVTVSAKTLGLIPSFYHQVRIIPMRGEAPAGEASDVSTITEDDGIVSPDGNKITGLGYGVNQNGTDGILASGGGYLYTFDQTSQTIAGTVASPIFDDAGNPLTGYQVWGQGIYGPNDLGLVQYNDETSGTDIQSFQILDPTAGGVLNGSWTAPATVSLNLAWDGFEGVNQQTPTLAQLAYNKQNDDTLVFSSSLPTGAPGPLVDLSTSTPSLPGDVAGDTIGFDPASNTALVGNASGLVSVNLTTASVASVPSGSCTAPTTGNGVSLDQIQIDATTHVAAIVCAWPNILLLYNLATGSETSEALWHDQGELYFSPEFAAIDSQAGKILVLGDNCPFSPASEAMRSRWSSWDTLGFVSLVTDANQLACVEVFNEQGALLETIPRFSTANASWWAGGQYLQVAHGKGYFWGQGGDSLEAFSY